MGSATSSSPRWSLSARMLDRLWFRLLLGMSLALAVAVGSVAVLTRLATSESFANYVEDVSTARSQRVDSVLSRHYQRRNTPRSIRTRVTAWAPRKIGCRRPEHRWGIPMCVRGPEPSLRRHLDTHTEASDS